MLELGAEHGGGTAAAHVQLGGQQHAQGRRREVDPQRAELARAGSADARLRAGFMLIPDSGASSVM